MGNQYVRLLPIIQLLADYYSAIVNAPDRQSATGRRSRPRQYGVDMPLQIVDLAGRMNVYVGFH